MSSMEKKRLPRRPLYWLLPLLFALPLLAGGRLCGVSLPAKAGTVDAGCPEGGGHSVKTRIPGMPVPFAHCLCVVLCLGLTVLLTLMGVAFPTVRLLTDQGLHLSIAQADAVIDRAVCRIGEAVDAPGPEVSL